jgi:hypothetical protein
MKKIFIVLLLLVSITAQSQKVKTTIGIDSVTNKTIKAILNSISFNVYGNPTVLFYDIDYYNPDDSVVVPSGTELKKRALSQKRFSYTFDDVYINPITKIYTTQNDSLGIELNSYFRLKIINTYPGMGGGKNLFDYIEAILKEVINIQKINGQL